MLTLYKGNNVSGLGDIWEASLTRNVYYDLRNQYFGRKCVLQNKNKKKTPDCYQKQA